MVNRGCNLECVKTKDNKEDKDEIIEFVGPVKIILVNQPKTAYRLKVWNAAFIVLAQMMIAANFFVIVFYSMTYKKKHYFQALHVFLCTIGLQLFLPMGVLNLNNLNGAAAPMKLSDRKFEHGILQIFGLSTTIAGAVISFFSEYPTFITPHCCFGMAVNSLALLSALVGIFSYFIPNEHFITIHHVLGILTILLASTCFLTGINKESFTDWLPLEEIFYTVGVFCVLYTFIVIYKPLQFLNS